MSETDKRLGAIRKLCEEAMPGPWVSEDTPGGFEHELHLWSRPDGPDSGGWVALVESEENRLFLIAARTDIPWLLDVLDTLQQENQALKARAKTQDRQLDRFEKRVACLEAPLTVPEFCAEQKWVPDDYYDCAELFNAIIAHRAEGV